MGGTGPAIGGDGQGRPRAGLAVDSSGHGQGRLWAGRGRLWPGTTRGIHGRTRPQARFYRASSCTTSFTTSSCRANLAHDMYPTQSASVVHRGSRIRPPCVQCGLAHGLHTRRPVAAHSRPSADLTCLPAHTHGRPHPRPAPIPSHTHSVPVNGRANSLTSTPPSRPCLHIPD